MLFPLVPSAPWKYSKAVHNCCSIYKCYSHHAFSGKPAWPPAQQLRYNFLLQQDRFRDVFWFRSIFGTLDENLTYYLQRPFINVLRPSGFLHHLAGHRNIHWNVLCYIAILLLRSWQQLMPLFKSAFHWKLLRFYSDEFLNVPVASTAILFHCDDFLWNYRSTLFI